MSLQLVKTQDDCTNLNLFDVPQPGTYVIQGPRASGKTTCVQKLLYHWYGYCKKVMLVTQSFHEVEHYKHCCPKIIHGSNVKLDKLLRKRSKALHPKFTVVVMEDDSFVLLPPSSEDIILELNRIARQNHIVLVLITQSITDIPIKVREGAAFMLLPNFRMIWTLDTLDRGWRDFATFNDQNIRTLPRYSPIVGKLGTKWLMQSPQHLQYDLTSTEKKEWKTRLSSSLQSPVFTIPNELLELIILYIRKGECISCPHCFYHLFST